ncbi:MAG: hypothetical protein GYA59_03560 [Chloroflexi bacterium]|nr:hypothetical protein [Chloroflexota bacterium]
MTNPSPRNRKPTDGGFFQELSLRIRLILRLMGDRRVNFFLKLLPVGTLIYLVFPDLLIGPVDDAMIIWLGGYLFIELCPAEVVEEHLSELRHVISGNWHDLEEPTNLLEGKSTEIKETPEDRQLSERNEAK